MTKKPNYAAMTVNERLWTAGLIEKFDEAILLRDRARAIEILTEVDAPDPDWIVDTIIARPEKYGYRKVAPPGLPSI